jgi:hypothetical protein
MLCGPRRRSTLRPHMLHSLLQLGASRGRLTSWLGGVSAGTDIGLGVVQFIHVAAGAAWFGASLFANAALLPYIGRQAPARQRELIVGIILGPERILIAAALGAAVTGLIRGIAFGRIQSLDGLATPYGIVWLAAIVIAVAVFATGGRVTSPAARALRDDDTLWGPGSDGRAANLLERVRLGFKLELAGITTILALMIVLRML